MIEDLVKSHLILSLITTFILGALFFYLGPGKFLPTLTYNTSTETKKEGTISVDVSGAVLNPGVYKLSYGSRVVDAVNVSGGISSDASGQWVSKHFNLSQVINDGKKIYVPFEWEVEAGNDYKYIEELYDVSSVKQSSTSSSDNEEKILININTATLSELDTLPGIGSVYALKIVNNRPYSSLEDLKNRANMSSSVVEKIQDLIEF